jgi:undecaprenyl-diphosphatase
MGFLEGLDWGTYYFFQYHRKTHETSPWLQNLTANLTTLGGGHVLTLIGLFTVVMLLVCRRYRTTLFVLLAFVGAGMLTTVLQAGIHRTRPPDARDTLGRVIEAGSFPSGHSLQSAVYYPTIAFMIAPLLPGRRQRIVLAVMIAFLVLMIGFTRLYLGCHFLTDVLGGWMIGLSWALICWNLDRWWGSSASGASREIATP